MSKVLKDSYQKLNRNSAHKPKLPEEEKNKALFSGSDFYAVIFFASQRVI